MIHIFWQKMKIVGSGEAALQGSASSRKKWEKSEWTKGRKMGGKMKGNENRSRETRVQGQQRNLC